MKVTKLTILCLIVSSFFGFVQLVSAQELLPLVPCGNTGQPECKTSDFFTLAKRIIDYFIFALAVPAATVAIAYAGINMALHPAEEGKRTEAKEILWAAVIGLALALGAWLIVNTLFKYLTDGKDIQNQIQEKTGVLNNS